jgi:hypothetical protein
MVNNYLTYLSGGISGIVEILFIHPIEYYKTLKQSSNPNLSFKKFYYQNTKKSIFGLYKGLYPRIIGIIPMRTVFWGTLKTSENILYKSQINKFYVPAISGATAGFFQTLIDCPVESLKTRMMNNKNVKINFNGFIPNSLRNIFFAILFNVQKKNFENNKNQNFYNDIFIGCFSGIFASLLTQPLDYLKTKKQFYGNKKNMLIILSEIKSYKQLWKGGGPRLIITCLSMSIGFPIFNMINCNIFNNI